MKKKPRSIVIVGGGTAGWMAANSLLTSWGDKVNITLVESEDIGIIGVGEGSTPYLKQYFTSLGIAESEWMPACDATYKAGISFPDWSTQAGYESYFHPFFSELDLKPAELFFHNSGLRRRGKEVDALPDHYFVSSQLIALNRSPVPKITLPFDVDYGYHFDSAKLGRFLKARALKLGLTHVIGHVESVETSISGHITSVNIGSQPSRSADFFIDCSGFAGLLVNKTLGLTFNSYKESLFNDAAVAMPTPLDLGGEIPAQTVSRALTNGWSWKIPLTSRWGNGYVFSSDFISPDNAETELRAQLGLLDADIEARHLKMRIGRLNEHWHKNCLAVGLSQGFIEPLEATALMLIQFTIERFISSFDDESKSIESTQIAYNKDLNRTFDGVRDYVVAHYKLNTRTDSRYWQACREDAITPDSLANLIATWDSGGDFEKALKQQQDNLVYLRPSWYCIFSGMGRFPSNTIKDPQSVPALKAKEYCYKIANEYFLNHKAQLDKVYLR
ncbi:tryptophan 7-halogenase [Shewanella abyssi]|uniref:tryptophan halogenase family protein n=1 Tax=Shewanella abyssi TaxID=311789 RepID=UPI00200EA252|nr:tryptophan 7-halogenase [Shewanella abyssi]